MKLLPFITFLTVVIAIWSFMHIFVYYRIIHLWSIAPGIRLMIKIVLLVLALSFFLGRLLASWLHSYWLMEISYIWLGVLSLFFFLLLVALPLNKIMPQWNSATAKTTLILTLLISVLSLINYARGHIVHQIELRTPSSLSLAKSLKIVQLSDLHISRNTPHQRVHRIIEDTLDQTPDLIVLTGDILEEAVPIDNYLVSEFSRLKAPLGVFATTGNHELYAGIQNAKDFLQACDIRLLRNQRIDIGDDISLIGFDDDEFKRRDEQISIEQMAVLKSLDNKRYNILLYHRPTYFAEHVQSGIHLQLSGHTHAGQTIPLNLIVYFYFRYPFGLHYLGESAIYTSRGTGIWGPPMRFPFRSEIAVFTVSSPTE